MNKNEFESVISELKQWGNVSSSVLYFEKKVCLMNNWPYAEIWSPDNDQKFMIWSGHWSNNEEYFCLLYTSPSPRDGLLSRMPSSA